MAVECCNLIFLINECIIYIYIISKKTEVWGGVICFMDTFLPFLFRLLAYIVVWTLTFLRVQRTWGRCSICWTCQMQRRSYHYGRLRWGHSGVHWCFPSSHAHGFWVQRPWGTLVWLIFQLERLGFLNRKQILCRIWHMAIWKSGVLLLQNEVIRPKINGMLDIMKSCAKAKTVCRLVFTSSAGTVCMQQHKQSAYDERCWSDVEFCMATKMTGWVSIVP